MSMGYINIVFQYYSIKRPMCHIAHLRNSSGQQRYDYSITLAKKISFPPFWELNCCLFVKTLMTLSQGCSMPSLVILVKIYKYRLNVFSFSSWKPWIPLIVLKDVMCQVWLKLQIGSIEDVEDENVKRTEGESSL